MAYKLKCRSCGHIYIAARSYYACPRAYCEANQPSLLEEVADVAVGVAIGYATGSLIEDAASAAVDVVSSIFDW